ncbi:MAG: hypothetical protein ACR2QV_17005 [Gammaproteobacteria bacterium]
MNFVRIGIVSLCLALLTSGCITTVTTPSYALAGDLVQVGLGGIKRNSTGKSLVGADITATITDANSVVHNVTVAGLFRAYPDYTSWYARDSLDRADGVFGNVEPYDGMWWATLSLADQSGNPLPLATGTATIAITSAELVDTGWASEGTLSNFTIEILAGTRSPTSAESQQYAAYRHQRVLTVSPNNLNGVSEVGGFQVSLTYNTSAVSTSAPPVIYPRVVPYSHDPNITLIQSTVNNGDGTETLTAMVTNPNGFVANADLGGDWAIGKSTFEDLEFAVIVVDTSALADGWESNYWLESAESYYIDLNGDAIVAVNPTLGRSF